MYTRMPGGQYSTFWEYVRKIHLVQSHARSGSQNHSHTLLPSKRGYYSRISCIQNKGCRDVSLFSPIMTETIKPNAEPIPNCQKGKGWTILTLRR